MHEAEKDLEIDSVQKDLNKIELRLGLMMDEIQSLEQDEQQWVADMLEALLAKTSKVRKPTDNTDRRSERQAAQSF